MNGPSLINRPRLPEPGTSTAPTVTAPALHSPVDQLSGLSLPEIPKTLRPKIVLPPGRDRGVFFVQERVGKDGIPFTLFKLRTMDARVPVPEQLCADAYAHGSLSKMEFDPRVTRFGRILRRYGVDELPQLLNLLLRDMRLVGIRPMPANELEQYPPDVRENYIRYRPGFVNVLYCFEVKGFDQRVEAIRGFFAERHDRPLSTDIKYAFKFVRAILSEGKRGL